MNILVTGGAGYIGSHMLKVLSKLGHSVVCLDNLSTGHKEFAMYGEFIDCDLANKALLKDVFDKFSFDAVVHFAAYSQVAESMENPGKYYRNNVTNTQNLLDVMVDSNVTSIVFSSTAAIFGNPEYSPIDENHIKSPINPYGRTKLAIEYMLNDYEIAHGIKSVSLRYFNAAGADPDGEIGERHIPETHLIPLVLQVASGEREEISIFGSDYNTNDGTCIRDYIHVLDLCEAHVLAINWLKNNGNSRQYNLGNGTGFSVKQVIDTSIKVTGRPIPVVIANRRLGDPDELIANSSLIMQELDWAPEYNSLEDIIAHAWRWEVKENRRRL